MKVGDNFSVSANLTFIWKKEISFGRDCLVSWDCCLFMDSDLHNIVNNVGEVINPPCKISIREHVWIGCRNLVLKGTVIPSYNVIAAGGIVTKVSEESNCIIASGCIKKNNINWIK